VILAIVGLLAVVVVIAVVTGHLRITVRRRDDRLDPPEDGLSVGRPCSWCYGTMDPPRHGPECPVRDRE